MCSYKMRTPFRSPQTYADLIALDSSGAKFQTHGYQLLMGKVMGEPIIYRGGYNKPLFLIALR